MQDNSYDKNPSSSAIFDGKEALTFCHAIATGDDDFAHGLGKHLISNLERTNGSDKILFYTIPLYPFAMKLYSIWSQIPVTYRADVLQPLGRYQQIFDNWTKPDKLADSLLDICDFHCEESTDAKNAYAAFAFHPYNLFPVEIMSIYRIREKLGLETPHIDHPLLSSLLLNPPKSILPVEDALLDKAIARFRSDFPDGIGW